MNSLVSRQAALRRVEELVLVARALADENTPAGTELRARLNEGATLSPAGIEYALSCSLETHPSSAELGQLIDSAASAPRVWVVLAANVFVAAHRAIALALAASESVLVRTSRRAPAMTQAMHALAPELFELVSEIAPVSGDHVHAYGSDETLAEIEAKLPRGVCYYAHGSGIGAAWVSDSANPELAAKSLVCDLTLFDQRGCLSPRVVALAPQIDAEAWVDRLVSALNLMERRIPRGDLSAEEQAAQCWFREVAAAVAERIEPAGAGWVALQRDPQAVLVPPIGRNLVVYQSESPLEYLGRQQELLTTVGVAGSQSAHAEARMLFPRARICELGQMQTPRFDGPVDCRTAPTLLS